MPSPKTKKNPSIFENEVSLKEGVIDAIEWFIANKDIVDKRFNILNK